jgi:Putative beta-barrel porin-2, OmpL-like. bbp2
MYKKIILSACVAILLGINVNAQKTAYTMPEVNKILKDMHLYISVELEDSIKVKSGLTNSQYLIPLINYIDYNVIGKGRVALIDDDKFREFILNNVEAGKTASQIGKELIVQYNLFKNSPLLAGEKEDAFHVGGFLVGEVEYHQEPDGKFKTLMELNQAKLYFAAHINSKSSSNKVDVFAEYNPLPEEVIHQIEEVVIKKATLQDTLFEPEISTSQNGLIPFERLFVTINNIADTKLNLTIGQFRNPFGLWSDYTSHRNFTSTKNNTLVNGFALKKIELGIKVDYQFNNNWDIEAAVVQGRFGRTAPLYREDFDDKKDFVTHITYSNKRFSAGASAYLAEFAFDKRTAYGIDVGYRFDKLLLSGEYVMQRNKEVNFNAPKIGSFINELSSNAAYLQFDYEISNKLHLFGMYDYWALKADGQTINKPAFKVFHGLKYFINPKTRWTIVEYGHMFHDGFDKGQTHLSTQLEINF